MSRSRKVQRAAFFYAGSVVVFTLVGVLGWLLAALLFPTGAGLDASLLGPMAATAAAYGCVLSFLAPALLDRRLAPALLILGGALFVLWPVLSFAMAKIVTANPTVRGTQTLALVVPTLGYAIAVLVARRLAPPAQAANPGS